MGFVLPKIFGPYRQQRVWLNWKRVLKPNGKWTKPPLRPGSPQRLAEPNDPDTFGFYAEALRNILQGHAEGLGISFLNSGLSGIDLDDCIDDAGALAPWAAELVICASTYTEVSPSGHGLHLIGIGHGERIYRNLVAAGGITVEVIRAGEKYFTLTGRQLAGTPTVLAELDALIDALAAATEPRADQPSPRRSISSRAAALRPPRPPRPSYRWRDLDRLIRDGERYPHRSDAIWFVVHELIRRGQSDETIIAILLDPNNRIGDHCREQPRGAEAYARRQVQRAREATKA